MRLREDRTVVLAVLLGVAALPAASSSVAWAASGQEIRATYRVDLAAFNLGEFQVNADFTGARYEMRAKGRFSLITGMPRSRAAVTRDAPSGMPGLFTTSSASSTRWAV